MQSTQRLPTHSGAQRRTAVYSGVWSTHSLVSGSRQALKLAHLVVSVPIDAVGQRV